MASSLSETMLNEKEIQKKYQSSHKEPCYSSSVTIKYSTRQNKLNFKTNTALNSEQAVRWPGKMAGVRGQVHGSIILPSVSRLPSILIIGGQVVSFLGDAKRTSQSGLRTIQLTFKNAARPC